MKKGLLMGLAVTASVVTLTGCSLTSTKTLKCTNSTTISGVTTENTLTYTFKDNKIIKAEDKRVVKLSGVSDDVKEAYKKSTSNAAEQAKAIKGVTVKTDTSKSDEVSITLTYNVDGMSDSDKTSKRMNNSIESMNDLLTKEGYTCK